MNSRTLRRIVLHHLSIALTQGWWKAERPGRTPRHVFGRSRIATAMITAHFADGSARAENLEVNDASTDVLVLVWDTEPFVILTPVAFFGVARHEEVVVDYTTVSTPVLGASQPAVTPFCWGLYCFLSVHDHIREENEGTIK
ncbi:hypothetical protein MKZ38_001023 [Zalerion maritima]|uniref:Uncharacterized protein n=1 Tax=Zalerion maritima TaxID=339359 RepID=A0AAD5WU44_9PEZI|nr:hypothetical protein MKZ38_001023 [Zalerion maritima]